MSSNLRRDTTLIAVASISPRIWEQDKATWKAWYVSLTASAATKQSYKRYIADFYYEVNKTIAEVTEQDILDYDAELSKILSPSSVNTRLRAIRAYWKFAQSQHSQI